MEPIYLNSAFATHLLKHFPLDRNSDDYWKLRIAEMIASPRCNIPVTDSLELYVYDHLLPGMSSWKEYYDFLVDMIETYKVNN